MSKILPMLLLTVAMLFCGATPTPLPQPPAPPPLPATTLQITTQTLPSAISNKSYAATLTANQKNVRWRVITGKLPPGLVLNSSTGQITGTPSSVLTATTYWFTVEVQSQ